MKNMTLHYLNQAIEEDCPIVIAEQFRYQEAWEADEIYPEYGEYDAYQRALQQEFEQWYEKYVDLL